MEYFQLTVRTGVPGYVDASGGIHIDGFPQLVGIRRLGLVSRLLQKVFGRRMTDRRDLKQETKVPMFKDEFMIEVPLDVDVSSITGMKFPGPVQFKLARPQDIDEYVCGEVI